MTPQEKLFNEFEILKNELIELYDTKGMRASGEWANNLTNSSKELKGVLQGFNYSQQLETGRDAGKFPPIQMIEKWIVNKGISFENIKLSSLAFLIARKISIQGWDRADFGGVELISQVVTEERIKQIVMNVGDIYTAEFVTDIIKVIKNDSI